MKIARMLWNLMAVIGILVTMVTIGQQAIELATFVLSTIQGAAS